MGWPKRSHSVWHISGSSWIRRVAEIPVFLNGNSIRIILSIGFVSFYQDGPKSFITLTGVPCLILRYGSFPDVRENTAP